jgi:hypothetical protein
MFFTFDNKRPSRENAESAYPNDFNLVRHEIKQDTETGGADTGGPSYYYQTDCPVPDRQTSLSKAQCLSESGYVLSNVAERNKSQQNKFKDRHTFNRHTIHHCQHDPSLFKGRRLKLDSASLISKSNHLFDLVNENNKKYSKLFIQFFFEHA